MGSHRPPVLADWLFGLLAPKQIRLDVLDDLHEEWRTILTQAGPIRARFWYWRQVLGSVAHYRVARGARNSRRGRAAQSLKQPRLPLGPLLDSLFQDARLAVRGLIKTPGFTGIALLTLALCIGANTTIFSVVQSVLLRPLPYNEPDRVVQINETHPDRGWTISFSHPNFWDVWDQNESFSEMAAMTGAAMNLTGFEDAERLSGRLVSAGFFRVLGMEPIVGRNFLPSDDQPGGDNLVVLLGNNFWTRRFAGDPAVVGRTIELDNVSYSVIGVLPEANPFPGQTDVFVPLVRGTNTNRSDHRLMVTGRLKPDVTLDVAIADLEAITAGIGNQDADGVLGVSVTPSSRWVASTQLRVALWVLMGAVGFLLLIACVNVTNLLLARATGRQRETAVCAALGATRRRLTSRMLMESMILGLTGSGLGVALAVLGMRVVRTYNPGGIQRIAEIGINHWVLGFTMIVALLTGLVTGVVPGLQMRYGNLLTSLRDGDRGVAGSRRQNRTRNALITVETALSLMLLVGAGLLIRSFNQLQQADTGFDSENRMSFEVNLPQSYGNDQATALLEQFLARIQGVQQVRAAGAVNMQPVAGGSVGMGIATEEQMNDENAVIWVDWRFVTPDYFRTMGLPLLNGRNFSDRDRIADPWQVIVSQPLADRLWPGENPIGRRAGLWADPERNAEIIGVVGGMRERGPQADPTMVVYMPYYGASWSPVTILVHTVGNPNPVVPVLRNMLQEIDPNVPISNIALMDDVVNNSVAGNRFNTLLLGVFAAVALLLALAGIYGVLAYSVTRRFSEIGLRVALGASSSDVLRQIVVQGMRPVMVGIVIGVLGAVGLSRFMSTLLFEIRPTDPVTYLVVALLLSGAALGACYLPARKALRVDPKVALAAE